MGSLNLKGRIYKGKANSADEVSEQNREFLRIPQVPDKPKQNRDEELGDDPFDAIREKLKSQLEAQLKESFRGIETNTDVGFDEWCNAQEDKGDYWLYEGRDEESQEIRYIGISAREDNTRFEEHERPSKKKLGGKNKDAHIERADLDFRRTGTVKGMTHYEAKSAEQAAIDIFGGKENLNNIYDSIRKTRKSYEKRVSLGNSILVASNYKQMQKLSPGQLRDVEKNVDAFLNLPTGDPSKTVASMVKMYNLMLK